ncbi:MAG: membrane protein insertase YidC [Deltaproteobacteria bacterium]|nr:membrane protein insertase YidC [Deltaproteobacteria bacterium]
MEKRAFIAVIISILIIILYQEYMRRFYPPVEPPARETATQPRKEQPAPNLVPEQTPLAVPAPATPPLPAPPPLPETASPGTVPVEQGPRPSVREVTVETSGYIARFTSQGARLTSFRLKRYRDDIAENSPLIDMVSHLPGMEYPLGLRVRGTRSGTDQGIVYDVQGADLKLGTADSGSLTFSGVTPAGRRVVKQLTFSGSSYAVDVAVSMEGSPQAPGLLFTTHGQSKGVKKDARFEGVIALRGGDLLRPSEIDTKTPLKLDGGLSWVGFGQTYFVSAFLPPEGVDTSATVVNNLSPERREAMSGWFSMADYSDTVFALEIRTLGSAGAPGTARYQLFMGPKVLNLLKSFRRGLDESIDFGYFGFISVPMLQAMHFFQTYTGNYGLDIILLTLIIKLLLWPLTQKSFVSMKRMQKLQPQMQRLKDKFGDDKTRLNKEMMDLYKRNKVNPLGGCLPMLLQFPFFIGFYNALLTPIELRHASFLWIKDLSRPDWESLPFTLFGFEAGIPVLVLLMGASMFIQQWMSPAIGDPNQRRMMMLMPLIFTVIFVSFPSGLTIYWFVNNLLSILQQYMINRKER